MHKALRVGLGISVLVLGVAVFGFLIFQREDGSVPESSSGWISSEQCAACHGAIFAEWKKDLHSQAWTDPDVRKLSNNFANTDCIACHAPRPVFEAGVGQRIMPRLTRRTEGVDCISCHAAPEGMAASKPGLKAACKPVHKEELRKPIFCAGCHNQHGTVSEWEKTEYAKKGIGCVECHMSTTGPTGSPKVTHHMSVRSDPKSIASALTWEFKIEGRDAKVRIANTGAGHDFPTDSRHKVVDLKYRFLVDGQKEGDWLRLARFRFPYRDDQIDLQRTTIPAGEERNFSFAFPETLAAESKGKIELVLLYKWTPFTEDKDAIVVFREFREFGP